MYRSNISLIAIAAFLFGVSQAAAEPTALVEDISTDREDVQFMDYLEQGMVIELSPGETLVIGYFLSCFQETITGGSVTIGEEESEVSGGSVDIVEVDCDGGPIVAEIQVGGVEIEAGAGAIRATKAINLPDPDRIIFSLSPIVKLSIDVPNLVLIRYDEEEAERTIPADGRNVDFEKLGIQLVRGGTYGLTAGDLSIVFKVSRLPEEEGVSLLKRFLPL